LRFVPGTGALYWAAALPFSNVSGIINGNNQ
jgi:hypothetical protein